MAGTDDAGDGGFLSRWSRRKGLVRQGAVAPEPAATPQPQPQPQPQPVDAAAALAPAETHPLAALAPANSHPLPALAPASVAPEAPAAEAPPAPTLADVALLDHQSDFSRFVAPGVDTGVKNAALKKLFTDPHFNVMDRLDTYIDDYGQPDPLPEGMLRQMAQSQFLGLFTDDPKPAAELADGPAKPPGLPAAATRQPAVDGAAAAAANAPALLTPPSDEDADLRLQPLDAAGPAGPDQGPGPDAGRQH